ncbi:MAG: site-2 protease family protein [Clostridia bacterium]|nr:site-2 protease family protein [Clostridia bacterium]MBR6752966.1 site-2 protease family protein [Clostridia bacterium]
MSVFYILAAILMLGIMVMVHEAGHFFAARLTGIPVKEFAIGFGPKLASWNSKKHETKFFIRLIPMGGYCMFYGEDDTEEKEKDDERNLNNFPVWKRLVTILMGPVMNFVLAMVVAIGITGFVGVVDDVLVYTKIMEVTPFSAADAAGVKPGDVIVQVNGQSAQGFTEDGEYIISDAIRSYQEGDEAIAVTVRRGGTEKQLFLTPAFDANENRMMVGIVMRAQLERSFSPVPFGEVIPRAFDTCVQNARDIFDGLIGLFTKKDALKDAAGPMGIIQQVAEYTQMIDWVYYLELMVFISVNLGLFNLLPIPGLDGSRLVFLAIEGICRKPVPRKIEAYIHMAGYLLLIGFMIFITFQDVGRIF